MKKKAIAICSALLTSLPLVANATPMTFAFTTPDWIDNTNAALFGTKLNMSITVDNGGTSNQAQDFNFSQILSIDATAVGGTYSHYFDVGTDVYQYIDNLPFITTDATGAPTLRLGTQNSATGAAEIDTQNTVDPSITLVQGSAGSAFYGAIVLTGFQSGDYAEIPAGTDTTYQAINITGQPQTTVPEPPTLALFSIGLLGLIGMGTKRRPLLS